MASLLALLREVAEQLPHSRTPRDILRALGETAAGLVGDGRTRICSPGQTEQPLLYPIVGHAVLEVRGEVDESQDDALRILVGMGREALHRLSLSKELDYVRHLKLEMLPDASLRQDGYEAAAWLLPAAQTGGDLYDYWPIDDHRFCFFLADATGHGLGPALVVSHCRGLLRGMSSASEVPDLVDLTARLSRLLCQDTPVDRFVTACLGLVDTHTHTVSLVCAGHGGLIFVQRGEVIEDDWPPADPPLGVSLRTVYHQHSLPLLTGDRLVIVTDGFVEATSPNGESFAAAGVERALRNHRNGARACIRSLYEELLVFTEKGPQADDLAVLVIEREEDNPDETPS